MYFLSGHLSILSPRGVGSVLSQRYCLSRLAHVPRVILVCVCMYPHVCMFVYFGFILGSGEKDNPLNLMLTMKNIHVVLRFPTFYESAGRKPCRK